MQTLCMMLLVLVILLPFDLLPVLEQVMLPHSPLLGKRACTILLTLLQDIAIAGSPFLNLLSQ
jgi:hypothetical protein